MGFEKIASVIIPLGLTLISVIGVAAVFLAGITTDSLPLLVISTANFNAPSSSFIKIVDELTARDISFPNLSDLSPRNILPRADAAAGLGGENFTAKTFDLADEYKVYLWKYCRIVGTESNCTDAKMNWAAESLDLKIIEKNASASAGTNITLPEEIKSPLNSFVLISRFTQLIFVSAFMNGIVEFIFIIVTLFYTFKPFMTPFISAHATFTILIATILATLQGTMVTNALDGTAKSFGVESEIGIIFLMISYVAVALSVGAAFFLIFRGGDVGNSRDQGSSENKDFDTEKLGSNAPYSRMNDT